MAQYNFFNKKLSNSQLSKLKSGIKSGAQLTINLSSGDETNFLHQLILTDIQVSKILSAFANVSTASKIFSKTRLYKMVQLGVQLLLQVLMGR